MKEYITFHQTNFLKNEIGINHLFLLNTNAHVGIQQIHSDVKRNPKNPNQIELSEKIEIDENEFNFFVNPQDAFDSVHSFVYEEFTEKEKKNKSLYFYVFEQTDITEKPILRGVFYATLLTMKPTFYVGFVKKFEEEYLKEIYKDNKTS